MTQISEPAENSERKVGIEIPKSTVDRISRRLLNSDFSSVENYVEYVLDQVLNELETESGTKKTSQENVFSKEDQEDVEGRLRDLGYL